MPRRKATRRQRQRRTRRYRKSRVQRGGRTVCDINTIYEKCNELNYQIDLNIVNYPQLKSQIQNWIRDLIVNRSIMTVTQESNVRIEGHELDNLTAALFDLCITIKNCLRSNPEYEGAIISVLTQTGLYPGEIVIGAPLPGVNANGNAVGPLNVAQQLVFANNNGPPFVLGPNNNHIVQALQFGNGNMSPIAHQPNN